MKYNAQITKHLAEYKVGTLGIIENGTWWKNKKEYQHILPKNKFIENIIDKGFQMELLSLICIDDLHLGFHHLNSSQALALNLFGPLIITNNLSVIGNLLQIEIYDSAESEFEHIENQNENTNFDYYIEGNNLNIYFEVKYTEDSFGTAKDDEEHKNKYLKIYKDKLDNIVKITRKQFFNNYQLWRNILYSDNGYIVFVLPFFRKDLIDIVESAKKMISENQKIKILYIEDIVNKCKNIDALKDHYIEFEKKYLNFV